jgi:hypothetical protein
MPDIGQVLQLKVRPVEIDSLGCHGSAPGPRDREGLPRREPRQRPYQA